MLSRNFFVKLNNMCNELGMNPRDLLLVMFYESGLNPAIQNSIGATGLIQFTPATLKGMGLSKDQVKNFKNESAEKQLDLVKRYIQGKNRKFTSATQYYHANIFPLTLSRWRGDDPIANKNVPVFSKNSKDRREVDAYNANSQLDTNKDGVVTVGDLTNIMMSSERSPKFKQFLSQLNSVAGPGKVSEKTHNRVRQPSGFLDQFMSKIDTMLDSFLKSASVKSDVSSDFFININSSSDVSANLEFAKILKLALQEEIGIRSEILTNEESVYVSCTLKNDNAQDILQEFCFAVSDAFELATKKIGGVKIYPLIICGEVNAKPLDLKTADINYRKFQLKFLKGNGL